MPNWANLMLTKKGKSLQAKAIAGANLAITKMKLGAGVIPDGVSPEDLTDLVDPKQILGLTSIEAQSGLARIQSIVTNADLETGYYIRECGVFADDPDEGEVMYAIMTDASPDFLPPGTSAVVISEEFSINIVTENIANITAIIDPEGIVTVANARKIAADAVAEHDESEEAHSGDHNLKGLVIGTDAVKATKKGDLLSLVAGKGIKLLGDISNKIITIIGKSKNSWNPNEAVAVGDIRYTEDGNGPSWAYLECGIAGTTGLSEPQLAAEASVGVEINDGTVVWIVKNIKGQSMLAAYPVGSIYMSVNATSPATLFGGSWEAMPAGRVLLAQGESSWGETYTAGDVGGEATHKLSVGELPAHNHSASVNTAALAGTWNAYANAPNTSGIISSSYYGSAVQGGSDANLYRYSIDVSHTHSVTISSTGTNQPHQNMQPFFVIYCWKRIA
ncbi:hypothetical protein [uncultured Phascolarctobacterium sp.]|uniref:phage baseplate protein n=1 Tax=uncultured Phascolarctobacterium sp. TaxID=512296 RepID=UPI0025DD14BA|nr:hypothetical protein [uncultured Phascolarctobacterium sp.]